MTSSSASPELCACVIDEPSNVGIAKDDPMTIERAIEFIEDLFDITAFDFFMYAQKLAVCDGHYNYPSCHLYTIIRYRYFYPLARL